MLEAAHAPVNWQKFAEYYTVRTTGKPCRHR